MKLFHLRSPLFIHFKFLYLAVDCKWGEWTYGNCSRTCGTGTRTNTRAKEVVERNGGSCYGDPMKVEECNTSPCIGKHIYTCSI